jgi:hypothetical protein
MVSSIAIGITSAVISAARKFPSTKKKHEDNENCTLGQILSHRLYGRIDKERAVQNCLDLDAWRKRAVDLLHLGVDQCRHTAAVAADQHHRRADDGLLAVFAGASRAQLRANPYLCDIFHPDGHTAPCRDDDIADLLHAFEAPSGADVIGFAIVDQIAGAAIQIVALDRHADVVEGQA